MSKELELRACNTIKAFLEYELGDNSCYTHEITDIEYDGDRSYTVSFKVHNNEDTTHWGDFQITFDDKLHNNEDVIHWGNFQITFDDKLKEFDEENFEQDCLIKIQLYEEHYEKVKTFNWTIKYFWMAILRD